jgi:hypothetical protein
MSDSNRSNRSVSPHNALAAGLVIGRFTIVKPLGRGGGGEVYEAWAGDPSERVALKLLRREQAEQHPDQAIAFQREFCRLQQLKHPRIIEVYERGGDPIGFFYTMELLTGSDLRELAPLPWRRACELLRDVALSLAIIHSRRLVHRDVSSGNVRCTEDGRAKLLDFGATVTAGVATNAIGTPQCMPPEALRREPLDARTDIYGLGALGYWLLTGRHAYPARNFAELELAWKSMPKPPSALAADVPEALDRLVMSALSLNANARPASAMEVINRLEAIAGLATLEPAEAAKASFVSPALMGRAAEVELISQHIRAALKGLGGSIIIEGEAGIGRSRLLGHLVLEAAGTDVVILHASSVAVRRPYGVLSALSEELRRTAPELARAGASGDGATLDQLLDPSAGAPAQALSHAERRHQLALAFHELLLGVSSSSTVILLVDDLHACDEPSAGAIAALALSARASHLLIVTTRETGARVEAPLAVQALSRVATRIRLQPLNRGDTEGLIQSVLGNVPDLKRVADWLYDIGQGNPAQTVELIQCLVDRSIVRYTDGAWTLPERLDHADLPSDIAQAFEQRLVQLSVPARRVLETMAVHARRMDLGEVLLLTDVDAAPGERESTLFAAVDELLAAHVLRLEGETYRFRHRVLADAVGRSVTPELRKSLHLHMGNSLLSHFDAKAPGSDSDLVSMHKRMMGAYHLMLGGDEERALAVALPQYESVEKVGHIPIWEGNEWYVDGGLRSLDVATRFNKPPWVKLHILTSLVMCGIHVDHRLIRFAEPALSRLREDTGLIYLDRFAGEPDPAKRVRKAIGTAAAAHEATPEAARGLHPIPAIAQFVRCTVSAAAICSHTFEVERMLEYRSMLEPLTHLAPPVQTWLDYISSMAERCSGRLDRETELRLKVLDGLERKELVTTTEVRVHMRGFTLYALGQHEAMQNPRQGLARATELEQQAPFMRYEAWQLRLLAHISAGNQREAQACGECMEIAALQGGAAKYQVQYSGLPFLAEAYALAGDLMGLKHMLEKLRPIADDTQAWSIFYCSARSQYHRLRGQLEEARTLAENAVRGVRAGGHRGWLFATITLIETLLESGQASSARELSEQALGEARAAELGSVAELRLLGVLARCEAELSELVAAHGHLDAALTLADRCHVEGILRGGLHEVAAELALRDNDKVAFEQHINSMARHSCTHENAILLNRYHRLLQRAEHQGLISPDSSVAARSPFAWVGLQREMLLELGPSGPTPEAILSMLLRKVGGSAGFLFASTSDGGLELVAPANGNPPLGLSAVLAASTKVDAVYSRSLVFDSQTATLTTVWRSPDGKLYQTMPLNALRDGGLEPTGAVAVAIVGEPPSMPQLDYLLAVGELLASVRHDVPSELDVPRALSS